MAWGFGGMRVSNANLVTSGILTSLLLPFKDI